MTKFFLSALILLTSVNGFLANENVLPPQGDEPPGTLLKSNPVFFDRFAALSAAKQSVDRSNQLHVRQFSGPKYINALRKISRLNLTAIYDGTEKELPSEKSATAIFPPFLTKPGSFESDVVFQRNSSALEEQQAAGERVIGGGPASAGSYLWCVAILDEDDATGCSGTLVGSRLVLTARHCAKGLPGGPKNIYVGERVGDGVGKKYKVKGKPYFPPSLPGYAGDADIMLLELEEAVVGVSPRAILPSDIPVENISYVRVIGFGRDMPPDNQGRAQGRAGIKNVADVPLNGGVSSVLGYNPAFEFCAGIRGLNIDSCQGDSGGAALVYVAEKNRSYLFGAVARGVKAQPGDTPRQLCGNGGVYTRVDKFRDWLRETAATLNVALPD